MAVIGSIVFARRAAAPDLRVSSRVAGTPTPTPQRADASDTPPAGADFLGTGSWTMSSLPDCFHERERRRGPLAQLRAHFPPAAERLRPAAVVHAGDCTIVVGEHDLRIARGADRLRVPPEAALYRTRGGLTLVFIAGNTAEIRRY